MVTLKDLESVTLYLFGWIVLCFREWVNKWYHQRQPTFFHLQFSSGMLSPAVQLQKQLDAAPPPPKKDKNQKESKTKFSHFITWASAAISDARMNNGISLTRKCSPLLLLYTLIKVLNSKDIYCCARLKLCGRNSKSFCHSQGLSSLILPCRMRQIWETNTL